VYTDSLKLYTENMHTGNDRCRQDIFKNHSFQAQFDTKTKVLRPGFEPGIVALRGRNA
jgi:hypothetical protein